MKWQVVLMVCLFQNTSCVKFDPIGRLEINPSIISHNDTKTFADIRTEGGLLDWQPYSLTVEPIVNLKAKINSPAYQDLLIRGPKGSDYTCFIPVARPSTEAASHGVSEPEHEPYFRRLKTNISKLKSTCLQSQGSYWSYEICPFRHVRQFHREFKKHSLASKLTDPTTAGALQSAQGSRLFDGVFGTILQSILGRNEQEVISEDVLLGRYIPEVSKDRLVNGVYIQSYIDGDRCSSEEPAPRVTEVKYECSLSKPIDHIIGVTEVSLCHYSVRVGTSKMCATDAASSLPISSISCVKTSTLQRWIETSWDLKKASSSNSSVPNRGIGTRSKKADASLFWRQKLRHFITHDRNEYPIIHKLVMEFMQSENMDQPDTEEDIPDVLVKKWLLLLGINDESTPSNSSSSFNHTDTQKRRGT